MNEFDSSKSTDYGGMRIDLLLHNFEVFIHYDPLDGLEFKRETPAIDRKSHEWYIFVTGVKSLKAHVFKKYGITNLGQAELEKRQQKKQVN